MVTHGEANGRINHMYEHYFNTLFVYIISKLLLYNQKIKNNYKTHEKHKETENTVPCVSAISKPYYGKEMLLPESHGDLLKSAL